MVALTLRLWAIQKTPGDDFYDAAVRSMTNSWHAFFFGALDPAAKLSIDKPPLDLWLQVASTQILGFGLTGLHLPEALGGAAACGLLFGVLHRPFGLLTAFVAALALAVLPIAVLTARSDTMDSLLAALEILAIGLSWKALHSGRARWSLLAALMMGLAFNVKLGEDLIAMPALILLWWWAAPERRRGRMMLGNAAMFLIVALSWATTASLTPLRQRPHPVGSVTGSIWHLIFVYNGLARVSGHGALGASSTVAGGGPGALRLLSTGASHYGALIGLELLGTLLLGSLAVASLGLTRIRAATRSSEGRLTIAFVVWFACGLLAFSTMRRLQPRYLEAFTPAMCALLGVAVSSLKANLRGWGTRGLAAAALALGCYAVAAYSIEQLVWIVLSLIALLTVCLVALLTKGSSGRSGKAKVTILCTALMIGICATPLGWDIAIIESSRSDSVLSDPTTPALSHYLLAHRKHARFEVASANVTDIVGLITRDDVPVIILNDVDGPTSSLARFRSQVLAQEVHFYFTTHPCPTGSRCPHNELWAYAHSVPISHYPGLRRFILHARKLDRRPTSVAARP